MTPPPPHGCPHGSLRDISDAEFQDGGGRGDRGGYAVPDGGAILVVISFFEKCSPVTIVMRWSHGECEASDQWEA